MSGWQPIETAPKDGRHVLTTWKKELLHIEPMFWTGNYWSYSYDGDTPTTQPTHWMPLPEPPQ